MLEMPLFKKFTKGQWIVHSVLIAILCITPMATAEQVSNAKVIDAMDIAQMDIKNLKNLIEGVQQVEINSEKEALISATHLYEVGKMKFRNGEIEEAYKNFIKASEMATEAQKSILVKRFEFYLAVTQELIDRCNKAGIPIEDFKESLNSAVKSKQEIEGSIREEIKELKSIVLFLEELKERIQKELESSQKDAEKEIAYADARLEETRLYPFFDSKPAGEQLKNAKKAYNEGRYLQAISYASTSSRISEGIIFLGRILYLAIVVFSAFSTWVLYERSKPRNRQSRLYRMIFSRGGGDVDVW